MANQPDLESEETSGGLSDQMGGPNADDQDILDKLIQGEEYRATYVLDSTYGDLELDLTPITDRKERYEYMSQLPSGWFDASQKDDPSEVDNIGSLIPDGDGIGALEEMVIQSIDQLTVVATGEVAAPSEVKILVTKRFSDEVLTKAGVKVLQISTEYNSDIDGFRPKE